MRVRTNFTAMAIIAALGSLGAGSTSFDRSQGPPRSEPRPEPSPEYSAERIARADAKRARKAARRAALARRMDP